MLSNSVEASLLQNTQTIFLLFFSHFLASFSASGLYYMHNRVYKITLFQDESDETGAETTPDTSGHGTFWFCSQKIEYWAF